MAKKRYFLIHKPFGILSQFSEEKGNPGLGSLYDLPRDVYPVGRLDKESEGLLILTNDTRLNKKLLDPSHQHKRTYWVEVEGEPKDAQLNLLRSGVDINISGKQHHTSPAEVSVLQEIPFEEREPPVNRIKHPTTSWLQIILTEGKNRQVRKMTAKVGHPTLRLVRVAIEGVGLHPLKAGEITQIAEKPLYRKLQIEP